MEVAILTTLPGAVLTSRGHPLFPAGSATAAAGPGAIVSAKSLTQIRLSWLRACGVLAAPDYEGPADVEYLPELRKLWEPKWTELYLLATTGWEQDGRRVFMAAEDAWQEIAATSAILHALPQHYSRTCHVTSSFPWPLHYRAACLIVSADDALMPDDLVSVVHRRPKWWKLWAKKEMYLRNAVPRWRKELGLSSADVEALMDPHHIVPPHLEIRLPPGLVRRA